MLIWRQVLSLDLEWQRNMTVVEWVMKYSCKKDKKHLQVRFFLFFCFLSMVFEKTKLWLAQFLFTFIPERNKSIGQQKKAWRRVLNQNGKIHHITEISCLFVYLWENRFAAELSCFVFFVQITVMDNSIQHHNSSMHWNRLQVMCHQWNSKSTYR